MQIVLEQKRLKSERLVIFSLKASEEAHGISHRNEKNGLKVRKIIKETGHIK